MNLDPLVGTQLANFFIERALGRGGMAMVYFGKDVKLDRPVAIKVIDTRLQGNPSYARRFVDEAKIVAQWRHENIVQVYYADNEGELYYFAMEYIDGATLEDLMEKYVDDGELMPHEDVIRIGQAVASALNYAHEKGVVHRDVKPSNVMIARDDRVILTDFGLALDTAQGSMGEVFGTPHYIAPEQARRSANAVPQSDVYSLGVVLYEMLTGVVPFDDPSATSIAIQHLSEPPPAPRFLNPELNVETEQVLLKALEKEADDRYATTTELMDALEQALNASTAAAPAAAAPPPAATPNRPPPPKRKVSRMSISDMLSVELEGREELTSAAPPPPAVTAPAQRKAQPTRPAQTVSKPNAQRTEASKPAQPEPVQASGGGANMGLIAALGGAVVVVLLVAVVFLIMGGGDDGDDNDTVAIVPTSAESVLETQNAQTEMAAAVATDVPTDVPSTDVPPTDMPTNTPIPATDVPTNTPVPPTDIPTFTPVPPTATVTPIPATATFTSVPATAVAFPNGRPVQITYNGAGFYLRNGSDSNIRVSRLIFQALDANGNRLFNDMNGNEWSRIYGTMEKGGRCMSIELLDQSSWSRPANCTQYNSQLTYQTTDNRIFWTGQNGATQFAVLWDEVEIARCAIADGYCEVRVGN